MEWIMDYKYYGLEFMNRYIIYIKQETRNGEKLEA